MKSTQENTTHVTFLHRTTAYFHEKEENKHYFIGILRLLYPDASEMRLFDNKHHGKSNEFEFTTKRMQALEGNNEKNPIKSKLVAQKFLRKLSKHLTQAEANSMSDFEKKYSHLKMLQQVLANKVHEEKLLLHGFDGTKLETKGKGKLLPDDAPFLQVSGLTCSICLILNELFLEVTLTNVFYKKLYSIFCVVVPPFKDFSTCTSTHSDPISSITPLESLKTSNLSIKLPIGYELGNLYLQIYYQKEPSDSYSFEQVILECSSQGTARVDNAEEKIKFHGK